MTESVVVQLVKAQADLDALVVEMAHMRALLDAAWVVAPMRWRKISTGTLLVVADGSLWVVSSIEVPEGLSKRDVTVALQRPGRARTYFRDVHPDDQVDVLKPAVEVDALKLLRRELGGDIVAPG